MANALNCEPTTAKKGRGAFFVIGVEANRASNAVLNERLFIFAAVFYHPKLSTRRFRDQPPECRYGSSGKAALG